MTPAQQMMSDCGLLYRTYPAVAVVLTVTCCLSVGLTILGIRRRTARGGGAFTLAMAAVAVWSIGYFLELVLPTADLRFTAAQVQYVGIVTLPPLWLLLAAGYTKKLDLGRPLRAGLLFVVPAVTLALAATSRWHGLLWSSVWMDSSISPRLLRFVHGPYFWINMASAYLMLLAGTALFVWSLAVSRPSRSSVSIAMIVAAAAPLVGNVLYVSGLNPQPRFDTTPFSFAVSGCAVAWVLFRHGFLDIVPFARTRVVETIGDPVVVVDAAGRIVDVNPAARALAAPPAPLVGALAAGFLPGWRDGDGGTPLPADFSMDGPSGRRTFTAEASEIRDRKGHPVGRVVVLHDVTERQRMEQVLRASEEKYRSLVEGIDQVIFSLDREGRFTYVSPVITRISGYTPAEIVGVPFSRFVYPEDVMLVARNIAARYRGEPGQNEFRVLDRDGRVMSVRTSSSPVLEGGITVGLTGIMTDVTEQRQMAAQLHQSQKMEAVGRLAGGVAHDFNNLLSAITGFTELLLLKETMDGESRDLLTEMRRSIERGAGLVRQLLAFGRKQVLQPRLFGLNDMARGLEKMLARLIGGNVTLALDLDADPCIVLADRSQVELAVVNLAVNARDAMPGGRDSHAGYPPLRGWRGAASGDRHGLRHVRHGEGPPLRALLHDEGARQRHGPGALGGLRDRQAERGHHLGGELSRCRHGTGDPLPCTARGQGGSRPGDGVGRGDSRAALVQHLDAVDDFPAPAVQRGNPVCLRPVGSFVDTSLQDDDLPSQAEDALLFDADDDVIGFPDGRIGVDDLPDLREDLLRIHDSPPGAMAACASRARRRYGRAPGPMIQPTRSAVHNRPGRPLSGTRGRARRPAARWRQRAPRGWPGTRATGPARRRGWAGRVCGRGSRSSPS